jgi:hypothetical protein
MGLVSMIGIPAMAVGLWSTFPVSGDASRLDFAAALGAVTLVHYLLSYQRLRWLLLGR